MAVVQIPVVIDIEGAFEDAAKRVASAMKPMKAAIEDNTAKIQLTIGSQWDDVRQAYVPIKKTLEDIVGLTSKVNNRTGKTTYTLTTNVQQLSVALENAKDQYSRLSAMEAKGVIIDYDKLDAYREAITVLMAEIELRRRNVGLVEKATLAEIERVNAINEGNYALTQEAKTMSQLNDKISALRGKLNNLDPGANKKEWTATAKEIEKATAAYERLQAKLQKPAGGPGSIARIREEMSKLEQQWNSMSKRRKFDGNGQLTASAQKIVDKFRQLSIESEKYGQSLSKIANVANPKIDATNKFLSLQSGLLGKLTSMAGAYVSAFGLMRLAKQIRDVTGELEYQRVALGHILNDTKAGNELFEKTVEAAKESPFRITQLVTYTKQLAAYRIEQESLFDTTKRLADISAGLGVDMNRLILAYGQVRAASVLRGQELRQFTEAGIPLVELLAKKFTKLRGEMVSTADVFKLISERAVPFEYIKEIFEEMTDAGGMFYKMQEEQAKTLKGRWEKLKDAYDKALMSIGENDTFQNWNDAILKILNGLADNLGKAVRLINAASIGWVAYKVATSNAAKATFGFISATIKSVTEMRKAVGAAMTFRAAMRALGDTLKKVSLGSWIGLALSGIATLVTYLTTFKNKAKDAAEPLTKMQRAIEDMKDANKQFAYEKDLIDSYKELASASERTATQNEHLASVMKELKTLYPDLTGKIGDENTKIEEQILLLDDAAKKKHESAVEEAKEQIKTQKQVIRGLQDEADAKKQAADKANRERESAEKKEAELVGTYYREGGEYAKRLKEKTIEAANAAKQASEEYGKAKDALADAEKELERLEELVDPKKKTKDLQAWAAEVLDLENRMLEPGETKVIFTESDLKGFSSIYDMSRKLDKKIKDLTTSLSGMKSQYDKMSKSKKASNAGVALKKEIDETDRLLKMAIAIKKQTGLEFSSDKTSYQQDPFIKQMQERIRFMKDFQKGYEDLNKYMDSNAALKKEGDIMRTRGLALGLSEAEQKKAAKDLADWYGSEMTRIYDDVQKKYNLSMTLEQFLSQEIKDTSNRGKALKDWQSLLQDIFNYQTDLKTDSLKKALGKAIEKVKDELKRSEVAKNLFQDILGLTGDENLATDLTVSVYGDTGKDIRDRIMDSISGAMNAEGISPDSVLGWKLKDAVNTMDFRSVMNNLDEFPDKVKEVVKEAAGIVEKYNLDTAKNYAKLLMSYDEVEQQRVNITKEASEKVRQIEAGLQAELLGMRRRGASEAEMNEARGRANVAKDAVLREQEQMLSKLEPKYRLFFSTVGVISEKSARKVAENQKKMLTDQFVRGQISLSRYKKELKEIHDQLQKYNRSDVIQNIISGKWGEVLVGELERYTDGLQAISSTIKTSDGFWVPDEDSKQFLSEVDKVLNFGNFVKTMKKGTIKIEEQASQASRKAYMEAIMRGKSATEAEADATAAAAGVISEAAGTMDSAAAGWGEALGNVAIVVKLFSSFAKMTEDMLDEDFRSTGKSSRNEPISVNGQRVDGITTGEVLTALQSLDEGFGKIMSMDLYGGMKTIVEGFSGITEKVKSANEQIEIQDHAISNLQYQYSRLENAMQKAFGSDYISIYEQQIETLRAEVEAYRKQAELERSKGKKADEFKAQRYEREAQKISDAIDDMSTKISEFMTETDYTSAAKDFAEAWLEAYKVFGSTTDAMKEKFNDMIQNMVVNSLAAQLIQSILKPIFDQIDYAAKDGALTAQEIAQISAMVPSAIDQIDSAMTGMVGELTAAGYNLRQQAGSFTGITRDYATASEESVTGLAAGINTQNFYISHIDANVAAILSAITGGASTAGASVTGEYVDPYKDYMMNQVEKYFPSYEQKLGDILNRLDRVIRPRTDRPDYVVHTNL